jgi:PelA/Pel-15E family pectate lyase
MTFRALLPIVFSAAIAAAAQADSAAVTAERIAQLPAETQREWREYLQQSHEELAADQFALYAELELHRMMDWRAPPEGEGVGRYLQNPPVWFAGEEARRIAEIVISFQTPAGGWGKHLDLRTRRREPGERFSNGGTGWNFAGTIDNGATTTELRFLAKVAAAQAAPGVRAALHRGLEYLLRAQYPSGGWPQVYPLMGGYHDAITFNDHAMVNVLRLFRDVADGEREFAAMPAELRRRAAASVERGLACLLGTQIVVNGRATGWGQQHDAFTFAPVSARAFEMVSLATAESAGLTRFLMELDAPSPQLVAAVRGCVEWFRATALEGYEWARADGDARLVARPGAGPLWPRCLEIGTDRALFGDRDGSIHDDVRELSTERRTGYAWYVSEPASILAKYAKWSAQHGPPR